MTTTEIERLVIAALNERAETTMKETNTAQELDRLHIGAEEMEHRGRRPWTGLAIAAAVVLIAGLVWWQNTGDPDAVPDPVEPVVELNASEQIAHDFVTAFFAYDRDLVASHLAEDARLTIGMRLGQDGWVTYNHFLESTFNQGIIEQCYQTQELTPDGARVGCLFDSHAYGSDQLDRGPYSDNFFDVTIKDNQVVDAWITWADSRNGFEEGMLQPIMTWLETTHPEDAAVMAAWEKPESTPAEVEESLTLWRERIAEYVAAVKAGEAK